jgi:hypothetical protein
VFKRRLLVEGWSGTFLDGESPLGAFSQAGPKAITVLVLNQPGFAVNDLQGALHA